MDGAVSWNADCSVFIQSVYALAAAWDSFCIK